MTYSKYFRALWAVSAALLLAGVMTAHALQLGRREAAEWIQTLERTERVSGLKIDEILARLDLKPGMVIADIGSGSGVFSRPLAKAVAPSGKVIAVDIEPGLLSYVSERAMKENIKNIETHLAVPDDAKLGGPIVDLVFIHDVLHHIEHRGVYLKNLAKYIKPDGRLALIEINFTDPEAPHREQPEQQVSMDQIMQWTAAAGLKQVQQFDLFPGKKHFLIFALDEHAGH
jgi:ubiquinone/menaquinone biosynthesis C-methylase UbiE